MIPEETIDRIRIQTDIVELIGESLELKRSGSSFQGLCPFHNEKSPSFNVNPERQTFHCFGCGESGDVIDWEQKYFNQSFKDACGRLAGRIGITLSHDSESPHRHTRPKLRRKRVIRKELPDVPELESGSDWEHEHLAGLRSLNISTIRLAIERGFLGFCWWNEKRSWVVTDKTRVNAQIRHLSGEPVFHSNGKPIKAQSISNSWAKWPLGSAEVKKPFILLTEGGPDFLSAIELCNLYDLPASPVGILGASMPIHEKAIPFFRGKIVHVAEHNDSAGRDATKRWREQLQGISLVIPFPMPKDDLNQAIEDLGPRATLDYLPYETEIPF